MSPLDKYTAECPVDTYTVACLADTYTIARLADTYTVARLADEYTAGRVGGYAADAVIVTGSVIAPDDLAANHRRVGGAAANPT